MLAMSSSLAIGTYCHHNNLQQVWYANLIVLQVPVLSLPKRFATLLLNAQRVPTTNTPTNIRLHRDSMRLWKRMASMVMALDIFRTQYGGLA